MEDVRIDHCPDRAQRVTQLGVGPPVDGRGARARSGEPEQHPNGGALARAVGADEAGDAPGRGREGQAVYGAHRPVALAQIVELDLGYGGSLFWLAASVAARLRN